MVTSCVSCLATTSPISNSEFDFRFISCASRQPRIIFAPFTGDRVRGVVYCFRCSKPRCIYAPKQLSTRERTLLDEIATNSVFSCGTPLLPLLHPLEDRIFMKTLRSCDEPVEMTFYSCNLDSIKTCCYCGSTDNPFSETEKDQDAIRRHRAVNVPLCMQCKLAGREERSLLPVKRTVQDEPCEWGVKKLTWSVLKSWRSTHSLSFNVAIIPVYIHCTHTTLSSHGDVKAVFNLLLWFHQYVKLWIRIEFHGFR